MVEKRCLTGFGKGAAQKRSTGGERKKNVYCARNVKGSNLFDETKEGRLEWRRGEELQSVKGNKATTERGGQKRQGGGTQTVNSNHMVV